MCSICMFYLCIFPFKYSAILTINVSNVYEFTVVKVYPPLDKYKFFYLYSDEAGSGRMLTDAYPGSLQWCKRCYVRTNH